MSMKDRVTFGVIVRDRALDRLETLVRSVRDNGADPAFIVVDYGSSDDFADQYQLFCAKEDLRYEKMHTQGRPWNRSHALNRIARMAQTRFVVVSDVDMIYVSNPIAYCLDAFEPDTMYHVDAYLIPKGGDLKKAYYNGRNPGPFQFIERSAFERSGGYDERIRYWGQEELDWVSRLIALGYKQVWLPEPHRLLHRWHPVSEQGGMRPVTANYATVERCFSNVLKPRIDQDWGLAVGPEDRPVMTLMGKEPPCPLDMSIGELGTQKGVQRLGEALLKERFLVLNLGPRLVPRPLTALADPVASLLRPITALTSLSCVYKANGNFDYFYALLDALQGGGLLDYYIVPDLTRIYLYNGSKKMESIA
jgi:hypothetical protein